MTRGTACKGALDLRIEASAGKVALAKLVERDRRLVETAVEVLAEPSSAAPCGVLRSMPSGRYVVTSTIGAGPQVTSWPVSLEPGAWCQLTIAIPDKAQRLGSHEVLIPGGRARLGGDPLSTETEEPQIIDVPSFILQRYPVTLEQWFEFLDALREQDPELAATHIPRTTLGMPTWHRAAGERTWIAEHTVPSSENPPDPNRLPVFGVSAVSAEAFAMWLSKKEGKAWRLPTELEWEKAGRGTDGRMYPWGDHFDATFCKMRDSRPGLPLAETIGAFSWDVSPYGVCDLAGGVWTTCNQAI